MIIRKLTKEKPSASNSEETFPRGELPERLFLGPSERCVEIPYAWEEIKGRKSVLDVGFTFSENSWIESLASLHKAGVSITATDFVSPQRVLDRYSPRLRHFVQTVPFQQLDLRKPGNLVGQFDAVTCISTIEHVGFDDVALRAKSSTFAEFNLQDSPTIKVKRSIDIDILTQLSKHIKPRGCLVMTLPINRRSDNVTLYDSLGVRRGLHLYSLENLKVLLDDVKDLDVTSVMLTYCRDLKVGLWRSFSLPSLEAGEMMIKASDIDWARTKSTALITAIKR